MSGILNIGTRALIANQAALQTAGNNIANVNTPGYSRQSVILNSVAGQFSGNGYYGKGVEVLTVQRAHSDFLTRQAAISSSVSASDTVRLDQLKQLQDIFQGGSTGLGAGVSDMLNSFSDVVGAPSDLTARSVTLTRADELAARFRAASSRMDDLKLGVRSQLADSVTAVNNLAIRIAEANDEIARAQGTGQSPNDLLDHRDRLISELGQYIQTTTVAADDGSVGIFVAGSLPLVLGNTVTPLSLSSDEFSDPAKAKLTMQRGSTSIVLDEATLGGGTIAGLLRFQNSDLVDAENLLGRMALAIGTAVNDQHHLGIDLNGAAGGDLFQLNPIPDGLPSSSNTGSATLQVTIQTTPTSGTASMAASNYEINFTGATAGSITRLSDGVVTVFAASPIQIDGLDIAIGAGAAAGDRFLITPFSDASATISTAFSSPRALAMANPVAASAGGANLGTLTLDSLAARSVPAPAAVTLTFTAPGTYTRSDTGATTYTYTPSQPIEYDLVTPGASGWSLTLKGSAQAGDTFTVQANAYPRLNAGNAEAMMALRDITMFDGATLTDGYAGAMSEIGVRVQSAGFAADVSKSIAVNIEKDRASVSGVNLDEEAATLLQFQQAYQASAKMLQIAQSLFDTLTQTIGR
ncbi:flagellar hook-associated protein FlgK [Rhodoferax sp.]|uniref:flagellar hook-associated protein FlgK n=1 Tax=Rhodoferax sp. TaxID=50421 RepID=UPI001EC7EE80|nr:flagellar hook-associated protein FlgK [Rhodoferax sp.]MBT9507714.1 flagellar hook-associated protein FlgK [Rhodoferax sp.]